MTAKHARLVANALLLTAGGALAIWALRQPAVRRAALRAVPLVVRGTPPLQVAMFVVASMVADRARSHNGSQGFGYATGRGSANRGDLAPPSGPTPLA